MAIQLRRGNEADLDISQLKPGECAACLDSGKIIVKLSGSNYLTLSDMPTLMAIVDEHTHTNALPSENGSGGADGFMSKEDKEKLNNITVMTGATYYSDGSSGLVPAPPRPGFGKYLRGDGTWSTPDHVESMALLSSDGEDFSGNQTWTSFLQDRDPDISGYDYLAVFYKQGDGVCCAVGTIYNGVSKPIQLIDWSFDSVNEALSVRTATFSASGTDYTFSSGTNDVFTIYKVVAYKMHSVG